MSDFWVKKLAEVQHRRPPLNTHRGDPGDQPSNTPQQYPKPWWDSVPPHLAQQATKQTTTVEYKPPQAQSANRSDRCPHCGSGNYMLVQTRPFEAFRCFNCSPMQSVASVQNTGGEAVQPARQVSTENNFRPDVIVSRA